MGLPTGYKVVLFADFRKSPHQIPVSPKHSNDMVEPAQPLNIDTLHNIHVVGELMQLTVASNAEIIVNSLWAEDLT